jgi:hypothetical protein
MEKTFLSKLDYSAILLSSFDISGSLLLQDNHRQSKGIKYDCKQLMGDLDVLENDYKNAVEKVMKDKAE